MQVSVLFSKHRNGPASAGPNDFLVLRPFSSSIHAIPIRRKRGLAHGLGILQCLLGGSHPGDCVPHSDAQEILKLLFIEILGIAQLAMHSPYETCGTGDTAELIGLARKLFSSSLAENGDGDYTIV